jgi:hypothetical protein
MQINEILWNLDGIIRGYNHHIIPSGKEFVIQGYIFGVLVEPTCSYWTTTMVFPQEGWSCRPYGGFHQNMEKLRNKYP